MYDHAPAPYDDIPESPSYFDYYTDEARNEANKEYQRNELDPYLERVASELPRKSQIILEGGGGCLGFSPYNLFVVNIDGLVIAKLEEDGEDGLYFIVPKSKYDEFWTEYLRVKDDLILNSYGKYILSGTYGFKLTVSFERLKESYSKSYWLTVGGFENKQIERVYGLLMQLVDEEYRIGSIDLDAFYKWMDEMIKEHNQRVDPTREGAQSVVPND